MASLFRMVVVLIALCAAFWAVGAVIFVMMAWDNVETKYARPAYVPNGHSDSTAD